MKANLQNYIFHFFFCTLILFGNQPNSKAQTVQWIKTGISEGFENGNAIASDDSGNVYVTGQIEFSSVFDSFILNSYGQHDIFVAKYGTDGILKWIHHAGGIGGDIGNGIAVDALHNVYITGEIEETSNFGSGVSLISAGANDGFVAKYDAGGNILWAKGFGTSASEKGRAIAVSPSGNIYITGNFSNSTDFGSTTLSSNGGNDIFVVKMDTDGDFIWAKKAGGSSQDRGYGIAIDASENVFVTGTFTSSATFKNTTITNSGNHSTFLAKYNDNGSLQWVKSSGDCCDTTKVNALALDSDGNIYLTGYFMDHTKFGSNQFTCLGVSDAFIVKYDPSGSVVWARQAGGVDEDGGYGIAVDNLNQLVYVTGLVRVQGNFGTNSYTVNGYKDVFVAAYDLDGTSLWVNTYGGHLRDVGLAITVDPLGYIYTTGLFNDNAYFGQFTVTGYPNQPWADFFVNKISPALAVTPTYQTSNLSITPGVCSDLKLTFISGNGSRRIVTAHEGAPVNSYPVNGNFYSDDTGFGNGNDLGNNNYVVYNGSDNNVTVTNLTPGTVYYFSVIEYNGYGVSSSYMTNGAAAGNAIAPIFSISVSASQNSICAGDSIDLHADGAADYSWTPSGNLSSDTSSIVNAKPLFTTTYTISGTTIDGCYAESNYTVNVNQLPVVNFLTPTLLCSNSVPVILSGGTPSGGIYNGPGVNNGLFNPSVTGAGLFTLYYNYIDMNGCTSEALSIADVHSLPAVALSSLPAVCENAFPIFLNIGFPGGGIYGGTGVSAGRFDPSIGQGSYQIDYSYTNTDGCTATASTAIVVNAAPSVSLGNDINVCADNSVQLNAGNGFSSYLWSNGAAASSIIADSSGTGLGSTNISVVVSNTFGCQDRDTVQITFDLCAGVNSMQNDFQNVSIFPNPFKIDFTFITRNTVAFNIYDICGRSIAMNENFNGSITMGEKFSPGIYFIEVISAGNRKVYSVLKGN